MIGDWLSDGAPRRATGESGAGKTEATKKCLQFFAAAAGDANRDISARLLSANPILEAFGNGKTVRNSNSSRFGKWMTVKFDGRTQICGCEITSFLLEKSRVVSQAPTERNFHIFYGLIAAVPADLAPAFRLGAVTSYHYTNQSGCVSVPDIRDAEDFGDMLDAMAQLGFDRTREVNPTLQVRPRIAICVSVCAPHATSAYPNATTAALHVHAVSGPHEVLAQVVAALLHLGNIAFAAIDRDSCAVAASSAPALACAAELLGVDVQALRGALTHRCARATGAFGPPSPHTHTHAHTLSHCPSLPPVSARCRRLVDAAGDRAEAPLSADEARARRGGGGGWRVPQ